MSKQVQCSKLMCRKKQHRIEFFSFISDFSHKIKNREQTLAAWKSIGILRKRGGKYQSSWKQCQRSGFPLCLYIHVCRNAATHFSGFWIRFLWSPSFEKQLYWLWIGCSSTNCGISRLIISSSHAMKGAALQFIQLIMLQSLSTALGDSSGYVTALWMMWYIHVWVYITCIILKLIYPEKLSIVIYLIDNDSNSIAKFSEVWQRCQ